MVEDTKQFGEPNELQRRVLKEIFIVSVVCCEPNAIIWHFLKNIIFAHYLSCMVHCTDFSLVWGLLRLAPITKKPAHRYNFSLLASFFLIGTFHTNKPVCLNICTVFA